MALPANRCDSARTQSLARHGAAVVPLMRSMIAVWGTSKVVGREQAELEGASITHAGAANASDEGDLDQHATYQLFRVFVPRTVLPTIKAAPVLPVQGWARRRHASGVAIDSPAPRIGAAPGRMLECAIVPAYPNEDTPPAAPSPVAARLGCVGKAHAARPLRCRVA